MCAGVEVGGGGGGGMWAKQACFLCERTWKVERNWSAAAASCHHGVVVAYQRVITLPASSHTVGFQRSCPARTYLEVEHVLVLAPDVGGVGLEGAAARERGERQGGGGHGERVRIEGVDAAGHGAALLSVCGGWEAEVEWRKAPAALTLCMMLLTARALTVTVSTLRQRRRASVERICGRWVGWESASVGGTGMDGWVDAQTAGGGRGARLVEGVGHQNGDAVLRGGGLHARGQVHVRGEVGGVNLFGVGEKPGQGTERGSISCLQVTSLLVCACIHPCFGGPLTLCALPTAPSMAQPAWSPKRMRSWKGSPSTCFV